MALFIIYVIRWAICLTLLYSIFRLVLSRETLHSFNRLVMLTIMALSMLLPICQMEFFGGNRIANGVNRFETVIADSVDNARISPVSTVDHNTPLDIRGAGVLPANVRDEGVSPANIAKGTPAPTNYWWIRILVFIYVGGLLVCWLRYMVAFASLLLLIIRGKRMSNPDIPSDIHVIACRGIKSPCSWMHWIIVNPDDINDTMRPVLIHEMAHVRLRHSWDMLLCELTARTLWFLPFAWMLRRDMKAIHEYQADRHVLRSGVDDESYQILLIHKAVGGQLSPVACSFNQSAVKKRLVMMCRRPSRRIAMLKAIYLLPLILFALIAFAKPTIVKDVDNVIKNEDKKAPLLNFYATYSTIDEKSDDDMPREEPLPENPLDEPNNVIDSVKVIKASKMTLNFISSNDSLALDNHYRPIADTIIRRDWQAEKLSEGVYISSMLGTFWLTGMDINYKPVFRNHFDKEKIKKVAPHMPLYRFVAYENNGRIYEITLELEEFIDDSKNNVILPKKYKTKVAPITRIEYLNMRSKLWIEKHDDFTLVTIFRMVGNSKYRVNVNSEDFTMTDTKTRDKYKCRGIYGSNEKHIAYELMNHHGTILPVELVFPPLEDGVEGLSIEGNVDNENFYENFLLKDVLHKSPKVIR